MQHHLVTLAWLVAALTCYALGLGLGATALFAAGIVFEIAFWTRLMRRISRERKPTRGVI